MALPGVSVQMQDRFYAKVRTDVPTGPRVVAIAKRSTASGTGSVPDLDTYIATSESEVIDAFGEDSNLHKAYMQLVSGGAQRIVLIPLPSDTTFTHNTGTVTSSSYGGDVFEPAFAAAETALPDIVVPWGAGSNSAHWQSPATPGDDGSFDYFYADNSTVLAYSWAAKVALKCSEITIRSYPCFAVLGVKPFIGAGAESMVPADVATHLTLPNLIDRDTIVNSSSEYVGHYVNVVATELRGLGHPSAWGYGNGACTYAGSVSRLNAWSATTNKPVYNVDRIRYNPTRTQSEALINMGVVPVGLDFFRVPRWIDGTTFSKTDSDYQRLSTLRIVFDAVKLVRNVSQNYIGEASSIQNRNSFETQISSALRGMQLQGALLTSDFRVTYVPAENKAIVDLALRPAFELRVIEVSVGVNF